MTLLRRLSFGMIILLAGCGPSAGPFETKLKDWDFIEAWPDAPDAAPAGELPRRTGKILVMRVDPRNPAILQLGGRQDPTVDAAWFELDAKIRAKNPDDVGMLIHTHPATVAGTHRVTEVVNGTPITVDKEFPQQVPVRFYDPKRQMRIGSAVVVCEGKAVDYVKPLLRLIRSMPAGD